MIAKDVKAKNFEQPEPVNVEEAFETGGETNVPYIRNRILLSHCTHFTFDTVTLRFGPILSDTLSKTHFRFRSSKKPHSQTLSSEIFGALI